jgi:hypothetical protein
MRLILVLNEKELCALGLAITEYHTFSEEKGVMSRLYDFKDANPFLVEKFYNWYKLCVDR